MKFDRGAEIEQAHQNASGKFAEVVAGHSCRDDRVVVRPHGTVVVRERVIARLVTSDGANAPTTERTLGEQGVGHEIRPCGPGHRGEEAVCGIKRAHTASLVGYV